ncbi:MAG: HAMP domain-containing protein, partial [Thermodesulfobacteriota bacterium]
MLEFFKKSIKIKIVSLIFVILMLGGGSMLFFTLQKVENALIDEHMSAADFAGEIVKRSIQNIMITGNAPLAGQLMDELKRIEGIKKIHIMRLDGTEAFRDLKTLNDVNKRLGGEVFKREAREPRRILSPDNPQLKQVFQEGKHTGYHGHEGYGEPAVEGGESLHTHLVPLLNEKRCQGCHGSDHKVRGVVMVVTSMEGINNNIKETSKTLFLASVSTLIVVGALLLMLINRVIVKPVLKMSKGVGKAAEGDLTVKVAIDSGDEIGSLGLSFNAMTDSLKEMISGIYQVAGKVNSVTKELLTSTDKLKGASDLQDVST